MVTADQKAHSLSPDNMAEITGEAEPLWAEAREGRPSDETAVRASASQVWDESDRGSLAAYYHFFVREVRDRTASILADGKSSEAATGAE